MALIRVAQAMLVVQLFVSGCFGGSDCRLLNCAPGLVCVALRGGCTQECPRVCAAPCTSQSQCGSTCSCSTDAFGVSFCSTDHFDTFEIRRPDGGRLEVSNLSQSACF